MEQTSRSGTTERARFGGEKHAKLPRTSRDDDTWANSERVIGSMVTWLDMNNTDRQQNGVRHDSPEVFRNDNNSVEASGHPKVSPQNLWDEALWQQMLEEFTIFPSAFLT
jgi:hypothetical protein